MIRCTAFRELGEALKNGQSRAEIAHNIVATRLDVVLSMSNPVTSALLSETRTIPIVAWTGDPIFAGSRNQSGATWR
jgi:ABC-type uncharacterized transport system substrate-binding protein